MSLAAVTTPRRSALAAPIACGCCLLAGAVYVAIDNPTNGGAFLPCPFRQLTGLWCPGCGLTRATHFLLRGQPLTALRFNLFVVPVLLAVVAGWTTWLLRSSGRDVDAWRRIPLWLPGVLVAVLAVFAVVRNLPGVDGLRG